jgi:hypothetical protein
MFNMFESKDIAIKAACVTLALLIVTVVPVVGEEADKDSVTTQDSIDNYKRSLESGKTDSATSTAPPSKIQYIRDETPPFDIPSYKGKWYEDTVPYTLDLAERCALAINAVTSPTDPNADYEIYWLAALWLNPPRMERDWNDWCQVKYMEALPLLRIASGSDLNNQVDGVWMTKLLQSIGPDGLAYIPTGGRPWAPPEPFWFSPVWQADRTTINLPDPSVTQYSHPWYCGRLIAAMTIYYLRDDNPMWQEIIEKMVDRLKELAIDKGDFAYFPKGAFAPNAATSKDAPMPVLDIATNQAWVLCGLAQYYKVSGYGPAGELAGKLARYIKDHSQHFDEQGRFLTVGGEVGGHFHMHTYGLMGILEYALAANDKELTRFVQSSYVWARTPEAFSNSVVGYFPEGVAENKSCESCQPADMIALALKMTDAGVGDYWDDVDRWVRNQFTENQMTRADWVYRRKPDAAVPLKSNQTTERVAERHVGGFSGGARANNFDWILLACCTGNGARTLYRVWNHILEVDDGNLKLNLLLNRASPWVDVHSYIPYQGAVALKLKKNCKDVAIRVPEWIPSNSDKVIATVEGEVRIVTWEGRYVHLGKVEMGKTALIEFPISERTIQERMGGSDYTLVIKGNTVVFIDPPGTGLPFYQRDHYRQPQVLWCQKKRFVPEDSIDW